MKKLTLTRTEQNEYRTIGELRNEFGSLICYTVELGWRNNKRNVSCIPNGEYIIRRHTSPRFGTCIKVFDKDGKSEVQGRAQILFHLGNFVNYQFNGVVRTDTDGCILPCPKIWNKTETSVRGAASSANEMTNLLQIVKNEDLRLIVRNKQADVQNEPVDSHIFLCPHCYKKIYTSKFAEA